MSQNLTANELSEAEAGHDHVARERNCLRCSTIFPSAWSGERICARCKGSESWRRGSPMHSHPARPNRR